MTVLWFIIAISVLVSVHEFGHFWVARRAGIRVLRFSIGFGPRLWSFCDKHGTEFALSALPFGGYVKMLDEREGDVPAQWRNQSFNSKHPAKKIAVALAGPVANFLLAALFYWFIFLRGTVGFAPVIAEVEPGSVAAYAGLGAGQEIVAIDGETVQTRRDVLMALLHRLGESGDITFTVVYPDSDARYESTGELKNWLKGEVEPDPARGLGIRFYSPPIDPVAHSVVPGSAAEAAGLKSGDRLVAIDGIVVTSWQQWADYVRQRPDIDIAIEIERDGETVELVLSPQKIKTDAGEFIGQAGIAARQQDFPEDMVRRQYYGLFGAVIKGIKETAETSAFVLVSLKKLVLGDISTKNLSGPIGIAQVAAEHAQGGAWAFLSFLAHLSVVLGVLNLLPIPVLDGGHVVFHVIEWLKGSPLSEKAQLISFQLGMLLLAVVMSLAFYNDIMRL